MEDNGVTYTELARLNNIEATVAYDDKRIVLKGCLTIDIQHGSYKYGPQLQIHLFTGTQPIFEERREHKKFTRIEIAAPEHEGADFLLHALQTLMKDGERERRHRNE